MTTRDGSHVSLWQDTVDAYTPRTTHTLQDRYDVVIIGGGITGITTALSLQQSGLKCLVLEAQQICYGTTGGTTAHINTLLDVPYSTIIKNFDVNTGLAVAQAAKDAIRDIRKNINQFDNSCAYSECQAYLFAQNEDQVNELKEINDACKMVGLRSRYVKALPLPIAFKKAIVVPGQAKFHPIRYVFKLAESFENLEGVILDHCTVTAIKEMDNSVIVESEKGKFAATYAIYATHIPPTINLIHLRVVPYRSYALAVELSSGSYPKDLAYDMYDPYHYYRTQHIDHKDYLIVGGKDHKTGHHANTDASFLTLESHVRSHFEVAAVTHRWSSQYYESADGLPYIGHFPGHSKNVLVATGFGGNGMTYSTVASRVLKDIILEKENPLIDVFSPTRIKPIASFKTFTEHNADVFKHVVGKLFTSAEAHQFAEVAPGDGKIFKIDGHPVGVSKDVHGALHAVNASCTHMKCTVTWNLTEKSWDCPCHGARFSMDGKMLNGPATNDLEYANLELINTLKS